MRRLRGLRRSQDEAYDEIPPDEDMPFEDEDEELPLVPFVPVESERSYDLEGDDLLDEPRSRRLRGPRVRIARPHLQRPTSPVEVRFEVLVLVAALIALGIFGTLLNLDEVEGDARDWWPAAIIGLGVLWMLVALVQRRIPSFLGATALAGVGISALMDTQDVADLNETLLGVVLVMIGLGIVVRGFLLRQQTFG